MQRKPLNSEETRMMLAKFYGSASVEQKQADNDMEDFFDILNTIMDELETINRGKRDEEVVEKLKEMREKINVDELKRMAFEGRKMLKNNPKVVEEIFAKAGVKMENKTIVKTEDESETSSEEEEEREETALEEEEEEKKDENMNPNIKEYDIIKGKRSNLEENTAKFINVE